MYPRAILALSFVALALAACGGAPPAPAPTAAPTDASAPTGAPATAAPPTQAPALPTRAPTVAPTLAAVTPLPSPTPGPAVLPAPAYALAGVGAPAQIVRVEPDGRAAALVTFEPLAVRDFDVAAAAGALVYIYGDDLGGTLVALDGGGRRELLSGRLSAPRVSPDGRQIVVRVDSPAPGLIVGQESAPAGVYALSPAGGRPSLLLADDDAAGQPAPDGTAWSYTPIAFSPDGGRLLLWAYNLAGPALPGGELVIMDLAGGDLVRSQATCCEGAEWSVDGAAVTIVGGPPGPDIRFGLYRIDASSGAERALIAQGDSYPLVVGARQLADGAVYAFYQDVAQSDYSWEYPFSPSMVKVAADGAITPLRADSWPVLSALWRADASGALVAARDDAAGAGPDGRLVWLPSGGSGAAPTETFGRQMRWADTARPLASGDCALLPQIAWQPPESRAFSAGVADLQGRLNFLGLDAGPPDGFFGDKTRDALNQYRAGQGLPQSDALDCATWQALLGGL